MIGTRSLDQIAREVERVAGRGLLAAGTYLMGRLKEKVSVPAPRRKAYRRDGSGWYWVATTRATPGAPPRKLSGRMRAAIMVRQPSANRVQIGVFNLPYPGRHERGMHKWLMPTLREELPNLDRIIGDTFRFSRHV